MSKYFTYFPTLSHDLKQDGDFKQVTNILRRFKVRDSLRDNVGVFYEYDIRAGDRPDIIAEKYYGDSDYAWVVLHFNDIVDPVFDWPLFNTDFDNYIKGKYGSIPEAQAEVHEYRRILTPQKTLDDGTVIQERYVVVDQTTYNTLTETNRQSISKWDMEVAKNDEKTKIKILDKKYLNQIKGEVESILRNGL